MISYATFGVNDRTESRRFFEATLKPLGYKKFLDDGGSIAFAFEGNPKNPGTIWIVAPFNKEPAAPSNGTMFGFDAPSQAAVREFHAAALANGGTCEGEPGIREAYGPEFYIAYVRDPVGNKLAAVCRK